MSLGVRGHLRNNVVGYVALAVALSSGAYAAASITGRDVVDDSLKGRDIVESSLRGVVKGKGNYRVGHKLVVGEPSTVASVPLVRIPGLGRVEGQCTNFNGTIMGGIAFRNTTTERMLRAVLTFLPDDAAIDAGDTVYTRAREVGPGTPPAGLGYLRPLDGMVTGIIASATPPNDTRFPLGRFTGSIQLDQAADTCRFWAESTSSR